MENENKPATTTENKPTTRPRKLVKVKLPRATQGEEKIVFVAVNGKGYRIERGKEVEVPAPVAEVLRNAELAVDVVERHIENNERNEPNK